MEAGDADAMAHLGHMYANGNGVAQNNVTALRWFKEAAEQARPPASGVISCPALALCETHRISIAEPGMHTLVGFSFHASLA